MLSLARTINSRRVLAALLALPWALIALGYLTERLFYGEVVHATGEWAIRLTMAALIVTPLRRLFPHRAWTGWFVQRRRYLGVAAFAYAALHAAVYAQRAGLPKILDEAVELGMLTGWIAFAILLPLALTSNDASVRRLGPVWKRLHRLVYVATVLAFAHWVLVAFDPFAAYVHIAVLAVFEAVRLGPPRRRPA
jgi:methionine sulfoxide reductase heme-binding subunit